MAFIAAFAFKFNAAFNHCINGVIFAHAYIVAGIEAGTTLTNDDAACGNELAFMCFGAEALRVGVTSVVGARPVPFL